MRKMRPWPADKVERWSIDRLIPYAKNARTHTDAQVAAIAASIKEWGWTTPALVGEDGMVEGGTPWGLPRLQPERQGRDRGLGDAPWPPHYKKQRDEPPRVAPSRRKASGPSTERRGHRESTQPLITVAKAARKADALAGL